MLSEHHLFKYAFVHKTLAVAYPLKAMATPAFKSLYCLSKKKLASSEYGLIRRCQPRLWSILNLWISLSPLVWDSFGRFSSLGINLWAQRLLIPLGCHTSTFFSSDLFIPSTIGNILCHQDLSFATNRQEDDIVNDLFDFERSHQSFKTWHGCSMKAVIDGFPEVVMTRLCACCGGSELVGSLAIISWSWVQVICCRTSSITWHSVAMQAVLSIKSISTTDLNIFWCRYDDRTSATRFIGFKVCEKPATSPDRQTLRYFDFTRRWTKKFSKTTDDGLLLWCIFDVCYELGFGIWKRMRLKLSGTTERHKRDQGYTGHILIGSHRHQPPLYDIADVLWHVFHPLLLRCVQD